MTLGSLWGNAAPAKQYEKISLPTYYAGERGDTSGYSYGGTSTSKKAEKKQAAMSALTLIAFLFFLNILQNCLEDQMKESSKTTIMMVSPNQLQGREPNVDDQSLYQENMNENDQILKTRKLLSVEKTEENPNREGKFIHDFEVHERDWTNELTQITDEDLVGQKQKVDQLRDMWNKKKNSEKVYKKPNLEEEVMRVKVKKFVNNPVLSDIKSIPKLSQYWAMQKTTTVQPEPKYVEFEVPNKKVADFHEFEILNKKNENPELLDLDNSILHNAATSLRLQSNPNHMEVHNNPSGLKPRSPVGIVELMTNPGTIKEESRWKYEEPVEEIDSSPETNSHRTPEPTNFIKPIMTEANDYEDPLNTPRYRRSDELQTTLPSLDLFHPEINEITERPTTETEKSTTFYQAYTHPAQIFSSMWHTTQIPKTEKIDINNIYLTTAKPMVKYPVHRYSTYPSNHRLQYKPATRYQYSPYRRVAYETPLVRQEYYPMSVVGQYGGDESSTSLGVLQLIWTLVQSFAKPLARLVPHVSKVSGDAQCLDLLACEAYRVGTFMGPTAQTLAASFNSVLSWVMPETEKPSLESALAAARDNSCQKQIETCDAKSGGKSAMTAIAKLMEMKTNREARLP